MHLKGGCERKRPVNDNYNILNLSNWKIGAVNSAGVNEEAVYLEQELWEKT